jgi:thioredoxin 1
VKQCKERLLNYYMEGKMKSSLILAIFCLVITTGCLAIVSASEKPEDDLNELPVKGMVTMIDLGKKTCTQCKMMAPILERLEKEYRGKAAIVFINLLDYPEQKYKYKLKALPTQIFFNPTCEEVHRHVGFMSEEDIVAQLNKMGVE